MKKETIALILVGLLIGCGAIFLMTQGNPGNMGLCMACFLRDTAGALKLHTAPVVQYMRPEIIGLILGSFIISLLTKEFRPRGGSSPFLRFVMGMAVMIGALAFLGCPMRMVLRMAAGDLNAYIAFLGFVAGVFVGTIFLNNGFSLQRSYKQTCLEGMGMPITQILSLVVLLAAPSLLVFSEKGPGSMRAPVAIALVVALIAGALAQRIRLCQAGGVRDIIMFGDWNLMWGSIAVFIGALGYNFAIGNVNFTFDGMPIAHSDHIWSVLGLFIVGLGSTLLGGCPMRQLVLSGTGNSDSAITVLGMIIGAAFSHNYGLAGAPANAKEGVAGGVSPNGRIALIACLVILLIIGFANSKKEQRA